MSRGVCYGITQCDDFIKEGYACVTVDEGCLYELLPQVAGWVEDISREDFICETMAFCDTVIRCGGVVIKNAEETNGEYVSFQITNAFKEEWFRRKYKRFVALSEKITLEQFCSDFDSVFEIMVNIEDRWADAVYEDDTFYSMDRWVRAADTSAVFYLNSAVLMH